MGSYSKLKPGHVWLEVVEDRLGPRICLAGHTGSGYRLAGPKTICGGRVTGSWQVSLDEIIREATALAKATGTGQ